MIFGLELRSGESTKVDKYDYLEKPGMRVSENTFSWVDKLEYFSEAAALTLGAVALSKIGLSRVLPALEVTVAKNLENVAKAAESIKPFSPELAISHYIGSAEDFAQRMKIAFGKTGEIATNIATSLNDFSHQHLPYVDDLVVQNLSEHPYRIAEAGTGQIIFFGQFEKDSASGVSFKINSKQSFDDEYVAAVSAHEYVHVEQRALKARYDAGEPLSVRETARMIELINSHERLDAVESNFEKANFMERESAKYLTEVIGKTKNDKGLNYASFYTEVANSQSSIPENMAGLVRTQLEMAAHIQPRLENDDLGRNLYRILRGARASAHSRMRMNHKQYEMLFHEREANIFGNAVRKAYRLHIE
jgi:hypothetical protein